MALRLVTVDRETPMLLPPDLRDWVPGNHIVHFIVDAVSKLPKSRFFFNWRGTGSEQYPPEMLLALLIYSYCTGRFSSRVIEEATYSDVIIRYICGGDRHPDHDTICAFRQQNKALFEEAFLHVLLMAKETGGLKKVGTVSVDGTKIKANASKHSAVSYKRAGEQIEFLKNEIGKLVAKAEERDSKPLDEGLSIPDEIQRREQRIEKLEEARRIIEEQYEPELREKECAYEEKKAERDRKKKEGKPVKGHEPKPPSKTPPDKKQANFTDPESRIMKSGNGFEQAYNAQAVVDTDSMLVVGQRVSDEPNDKKELSADLASVSPEVIKPDAVLADNGYFSEAAIEAVEKDEGPKVYAAVEKQKHGRTVEQLERREDPAAPDETATTTEKMRHRLKTKEGRSLYNLRKQTVEPVFGIIKEALGFRRFSMRGKEKAETEWCLVCLAYNMKRLFNMKPESVQLPNLGMVTG